MDYPLLVVPQLDEQFYLEWARQLAGLPSQLPAVGHFMDPLLAWVLAASLTLLGDTTLPLRALNVAADCATAGVVMAIGARLWGRPTGLVAGLLYAGWPVAWFYAPLLLKTALTTLAASLAVLLLLRVVAQPDRIRNPLLLGTLLGGAVFLRGNLLLLIPLVVVVGAWLLRRRDAATVVRAGSSFIITLVAALLIGSAANERLSGRFAVLPSAGGLTFYTANNPDNPLGTHRPPAFVTQSSPFELVASYRAEAEERTGRTFSDEELAAFWRGEAIAYLFDSPGSLPRLLVAKLGQLLGHRELPNNHSIALARSYVPLLHLAMPAFALALGLGTIGLLLALRRDGRTLALLIPIGVVVATSLLYFSTSRFRLPMVPMLLLGTAWLFVHIRASGARAALPLLAAAAIALASFAIRPPPAGLDYLELNLAKAHGRIGEHAQAAELLATVSDATKASVAYADTLGAIALYAGEYATALGAIERVLTARPDDPTLLHNAGVAALRSGEATLALQRFERVFELEDQPEHLYWIGEAQRALGDNDAAAASYREAIARADEAGQGEARWARDSSAALAALITP